jgi:DNA polymerase elongation subunit (family B)
VYDFSSEKKSLKAFEIELGIPHKELNMPWDQPVPEDKWHLVAEYCDNDVLATESVFYNRYQDYVARCILAELSGLSVNDMTSTHTAKILFGNDPRPQDKFIYTDLSVLFPGYTFDNGQSFYRGEDPGEGGYVYSEPGIYEDVALLDVASMHPTSILAMNMFGPYTERYKELLDARLAIKHKDYAKAKQLLGGMLSKYLNDPKDAEALGYALKIHALNIVYGLTYASFDNKFKDPRNKDNIVAKRGALFMIDLKYALQEKGIKVIHIKTDSIKIPNATPEIIEFVNNFGLKYGYTFEHEATYKKLCLVNNAVYIAQKDSGEWTATGAEFAHPVVFKTLFSKEPLVFKDYCEPRAVTSASSLYLDMNEKLPKDEHNYIFIGRVGLFCPIKPGKGGGILYRFKNDKYYAVTGTKGYRWLEAEMVQTLGKEKDIDLSYSKALVDSAIEHISKFGNFKEFIK